MCDQCGMYNQTGPYAYREGHVPPTPRYKPMGERFLNAMTNSLSHAPEEGWCVKCHGCRHAAFVLCTMFNWLGKRGSFIPYDPRYDFDAQHYDVRNNDGK